MEIHRRFKSVLLFLVFMAGIGEAKSQLMNHYWTLNFNSESSLLSGAVVAGDAGNTSIYYNPATISEIEAGSNLSFATGLFSWGIYSYRNALGDGIHINGVNFNVLPQFLSYSFRANNSKFSFAVTAITRLKEDIKLNYYNSQRINVLHEIEGKENYTTSFNYHLNYIDNWIGAAGSYQISDKFSLGVSLFVSIAQLNYSNGNSAVAFSPTDTLWVDSIPNPSFVAEGTYEESYRFSHVRLIGKLGLNYTTGNLRLGINLTTRSLSLFSMKQEAMRTQRISDITNPETGQFLHGYIITNGMVGNQLNTRLIYPLSLSLGFIYNIRNDKNRLYFTMEYFARINPYQMVDAPIRDDITSSIVYDRLEEKDWLSVADASKDVINFAIGYRWRMNEKTVFMNGFRTDFNNVKNVNYGYLNQMNKINTTDFDIYHYSAGVQFEFLKKYQLIAGGELSFGYGTGMEQIANFTNPVEYNPVDNRVLQGPIKDNMDIYYFGFNVYLGITLNFNKHKNDDIRM